MATIKYQTADGQTVTVNQYKVNNILLADELGNDPTVAISQKAATSAINEVEGKVDNLNERIDNVYTKSEVDGKISAVDHSTFLTKDEASQTYQPKGEYLTEHQSLEDYAKKSEVEAEAQRASGKEAELEGKIGTNTTDIATLKGNVNNINSTLAAKAEKSEVSKVATDLNAETTRATQKENALQTAIDNLKSEVADLYVIDCGEY